MADDFIDALSSPSAQDAPRSPGDVKREKRKFLRKFYSDVLIEQIFDGRFAVLLDGKNLRTPAGAILSLPTRAAAELIAQEWRAQKDVVDFAHMPATRLVNSAMDGVAKNLSAVRDDLVKYAGSELVCYRADAPDNLVAAQARAFDPVLDFAKDRLGARFVLSEGVIFAQQPPEAIKTVSHAIDAHAKTSDAALKLAALHSMTTLTGSVLIALAHAAGAFNLEEAWASAHVDEDYQMALWGRDDEALAARAHKFEDFAAASRFWFALADAQ